MDPGVARVGRKLEDGYAPYLVEVVAVVLASSTAVAYGPQPARRSQTSIGDLKAMIRVCIMMGKDKVNWVRRTLQSYDSEMAVFDFRPGAARFSTRMLLWLKKRRADTLVVS